MRPNKLNPGLPRSDKSELAMTEKSENSVEFRILIFLTQYAIRIITIH
jgi:hypothetical protein